MLAILTRPWVEPLEQNFMHLQEFFVADLIDLGKKIQRGRQLRTKQLLFQDLDNREILLPACYADSHWFRSLRTDQTCLRAR